LRTWQKLVFLSLSFIFLFSVTKARSAQPTYIGDAKCKLCHKDQFAAVQTQKHAKAWAALKPEEQKKAECIACHSTGGASQPNVGCESCHGPGSAYAAPTIMNKAKWTANPAAQTKVAEAAGLVTKPDAKVCVKCHNKSSPTFKSFNFEDAKAKIKHWK
jgi:hypothetical protein